MACEGEGHNIDSRPFDKSCVKKNKTENIGIMEKGPGTSI